jgi:hypothetical protein
MSPSGRLQYSPFHHILFYSDAQQIDRCPPTLVRNIFFIRPLIQMFISAGNTLLPTHQNNILPAI